MTQITVNVEDDKMAQFLEDIKKLDYVEVQSTDWWDDLTERQKQRISKSVEMLDAGLGVPHEKVMKRVDDLIKKAKG